MKKKATLVLGGGSALGLAHIGVLEVLEKHFEINGIIGTSMGAIIGALYSLGISPAGILDIALRNSNARVFSPLNLDRKIQGVFDGKYLLKLFSEWTMDREIESGSLPFMACAYDLIGRRSVIFNKGKYALALRATSSLPLVFAPFAWQGHLFVDGGIEHPLPLAFSGLLSSEMVIAVNVLPFVEERALYIQELPGKSKTPRRVGRIEVVTQAVFQNQAYLAMRDINTYAPDIVIDAAMPEGRPFAFHKARYFYEYGLRQTENTLRNYREPSFLRHMRRHYRYLVSRKTGLPSE